VSEREARPAQVTVAPLQLVDAAGLHSCGIDRTGKLWCWGYNDSGQLGVGDLADRPTPVRPGCEAGQAGACFEDWVSVSGGSYHTCGIRLDGSLWCWGGNANAQLGVGTTGTNERTPLPVEASGRWSAVAAGHQHTCAIRKDGTLWCWGAGEYGQLGNGARERQNVPVAVLAPDSRSRFEQVLVSGGAGPDGGSHTCAVRNDRTLWCWGRNDHGQLGIGTRTEPGAASPRRVCLPRE
jgi:alpha-tubulin suppressor-like RCC1 family protein